MSVNIWEGTKAQELIDAITNKKDANIPESVKAALLLCFQNTAWVNSDGQVYYQKLYNALYQSPETVWDYAWDAASGVIPPGMTGIIEYNFTDKPEYLTLKGGGKLDFDYVGDCELVIEIYGNPYNNGNQSPEVSIASSNGETEGEYNGASFVLDYQKNNGNLFDNLSGNYVSTGIGYKTNHVYDFISENGQLRLLVDGVERAVGVGAQGGAVITGFNNNKWSITYIKNIKFRRL